MSINKNRFSVSAKDVVKRRKAREKLMAYL